MVGSVYLYIQQFTNFLSIYIHTVHYTVIIPHPPELASTATGLARRQGHSGLRDRGQHCGAQ